MVTHQQLGMAVVAAVLAQLARRELAEEQVVRVHLHP
jgi:hypothetical protein